MREARGRVRAVIAIVIVSIAILGLAPSVDARQTPPPTLERFLWALSRVESGGRYNARNATSGAYGKYQILPSTWRSWARHWLGNPNARPTPANQEKVVHLQVTMLWHRHHSWRVIAHVWLTGRAERSPSTWSPTARRYIAKVMRYYARWKPSVSTTVSPIKLIQDRSGAIVYSGNWRPARFGTYRGGTVEYAAGKGASAKLTFTGKSIRWYGPVGPTRGSAQVWIDGKLARTVSAHAASFSARVTLFGRSWSKVGRHTIEIVVVGSRGRPIVAIDAFGVGR